MSVLQYQPHNGGVDSSTPLDLKRLVNKSVIITGGASGLGKAYAKAFSAAGAFVTVGDVDEKAGPGLATEISTSGPGKVQFVRCDVRSWDDQINLFETAVKNSPNNSCDIVLANAGIAGQPFELLQEDDPALPPRKPDLRMLDINLGGVLYTAKLAIHFFKKQNLSSSHDRCLILKSSVAGYIDLIGSPIYNATKFGVRGLMRNLRWTSSKNSFRVNVVAPWFIETPIITNQPGAMEYLVAKGTEFALEEDAAKAMLRIASDGSVNGRSLAIVPRSWNSDGYMDLDQDDFKDGDPLQLWQKKVIEVSRNRHNEVGT